MGNWKIVVPEETENLVTNPSFETNATGWAASGTNTIAKSDDESKFGSNSLKCTYQNNTTLADYAITLPTADTTYGFSAYVFIPADWDGGAIQLAIANLTGSSLTAVSTTTAGKWVRLETTFTVASDVIGNVQVTTAGAPAAGKFVYIDAVQVEEKAYYTTYCDGDQDGCRWLGAEHASKSKRNQFSPAGGRVRDLGDDLNFVVEDEFGTGIPPVTNLSSPLPKQDGAIHEGQSVQPRTLALKGSIRGDTMQDYHSERKALIKALNSRTGEINQPSRARTLRYTGDVTEKDIQAVYGGGLHGTGNKGFAEDGIDLQLVADDPYFREVGNSSAVLDTNDSASYATIAARINGVWSNLGPPDAAGTYTSTRAILVLGDYVYIGGAFTNWDNIANADNIVRYNRITTTYSAMGTGANGSVIDIVAAPDGNIYVAGAFTTIGGVTCRGIAKWDVTAETWSALGPPSSGGTVEGIAIHPTTGDVYICGLFTNFDGIANADYVAKWNGSSWSALGTGLNNQAFVLAFDKGANLYVGGTFTTAGGGAAEAIAKWDGSAWSALGAGLTGGADPFCEALLITPDNTLYAGGLFTTAGTTTASNLAKWNGSSWSAISTGTNGQVQHIAQDSTGLLYISGNFSTAGDVSVTDGFTIWNGSVFTPGDFLNQTAGQPITVVEYDEVDGNLYLGIQTVGIVTISSAGSTTISYAGTIKAYPRITIKREGGTYAKLRSIRNVTTGADLWFDVYALLDGEEITIDLDPQNILMKSSLSGNVFDKLLPQSHVGQFYLTPGNGSGSQDNVITAFIDVSGSPTITAYMTWKTAYESTDG